MAHTPGSHRHSVVGAVNPCANMAAEGVARALGLAAKAPLGPARSPLFGRRWPGRGLPPCPHTADLGLKSKLARPATAARPHCTGPFRTIKDQTKSAHLIWGGAAYLGRASKA